MTACQRLKKYLDIERIHKIHDNVHAAFMERGPLAHNWDHVYKNRISGID